MQIFAHARVHFRTNCYSTPSRFLNNSTTTIVALRRTITNLHRNPNKMSETMRAVLVKDGKGPVENLYLGEAPKPAPKPNQVLVKVSTQSYFTLRYLGSICYLTYLLSCMVVDQGFRSESHGHCATFGPLPCPGWGFINPWCRVFWHS